MSTFLARELHRSKYRLLGLVGQGQFGRVYCAVHRKSGRLVALKELDRDRFSTHKFLRELRFLLSFQHENIVTCQALEHTATGRYLVMDYCEGGTLRSLMEEEVQLHPFQGLKLVQQILAGLEHAHQRGIVHCDIKPENILLNVTADGWCARISDFGIARLSQELSTDAFSNTGSPAYMAPERFYGQYSAASDLYAVGILLFELLTGDRPFSGPPADLMSAHLNQTVKIPASLPAEIRAILVKALQKLPARRFRSAAEMLQMVKMVGDRVLAELSHGWSESSILRMTKPITVQPFCYTYVETLNTPINRLVAGDDTPPTLLGLQGACPQKEPITAALPSPPETESFFRVFGCRVGYQTYAERCLSPLQMQTEALVEPAVGPWPLRVVRLPEAIVNLAICSRGGVAVTPQSIYLLPLELFQEHTAQHGQRHLQHSRKGDRLVLHAVPQLIAEFDQVIRVAIAPECHWIAAIGQDTPATTRLTLWNLKNLQPFNPQVSRLVKPCFQLLALDTRHVAAFSHTTDRSAAAITGVNIDIYTRRGTPFGELKLPLPLRQVYPTQFPYRVLATEPGYPNTVLVIDLKPLKIQRLDLPIAPKLVTSVPWGYVFMSDTGEIVVLDQYGQCVGHVAGPPNPTAIASLSSNKLVIANWQNTHGHLYVVDLQTFGLDILF